MANEGTQMRMNMLDELRANVRSEDDFRELGERTGFGMASVEIMVKTDSADFSRLLSLYEEYKRWQADKVKIDTLNQDSSKNKSGFPPEIQALCDEMQEYFKRNATDYYEIAQLTGFTAEQVVAIVKGETGERVDVLEVYEAFKVLIHNKTTGLVNDVQNCRKL